MHINWTRLESANCSEFRSLRFIFKKSSVIQVRIFIVARASRRPMFTARMHDLPARCPPRNRARISISQGSIRSFSAASCVQQRHCWRRSVRGLINAISLTSPWSFRTPSCRKRSSRREIACRFGHRGHTARLAGLLTPNPHRTPDTTKLSCLCRVRFGGVNWIPADNPRLSPTGNFEV